MTSEKQAQKFHNDDLSLCRSGYCFWLVVPRAKFDSTNQKHYPDLGSDASSVWNFCARFSDVIWRGNQWQRRRMSAVFSGYYFWCFVNCLIFVSGRAKVPCKQKIDYRLTSVLIVCPFRNQPFHICNRSKHKNITEFEFLNSNYDSPFTHCPWYTLSPVHP